MNIPVKQNILILSLLVVLLLPANLWLANFYFKTRLLAEKKIGIFSDPVNEYASLDPDFVIVAEKGNRKNSFWCIQKENAVNINVKEGRIHSIAGISSGDIFFWGISKNLLNLEVGKRDLQDFNQDFISDYMYWYPEQFIQVKGAWLPVKEMQWGPPRTAVLKDGRTFVWKKSAWREKK